MQVVPLTSKEIRNHWCKETTQIFTHGGPLTLPIVINYELIEREEVSENAKKASSPILWLVQS